MSKTKLSPLQQALLETEEILKVVEENAKNMLLTQMKPDLAKAIRESLDAEDEEEDESEISPSTGIEVVGYATDPVEDIEGSDDITDSSIENPIDNMDTDSETDLGGEPESLETGGEEEELDLTGASDEEVISVFRKMGDNAEIEIVPMDDKTFSVKDSNGTEVIVKINEGEYMPDDLGSYTDDEDKYSFIDDNDFYINQLGNEDMPSSDDEIVFEIDLSDEPVEQEDFIDEVARTHSDGRKMKRKPEGFFKYATSRLRSAETTSINEEQSAKNKVLLKEAEEKTTKLINENKALSEDLTQHKNVLRQLREALETVGMMNTNLAHVNNLFTKYATTSDEKINIIKRFDSVETLKESKNLFKTISAELKSSKSVIAESVENVISNKVSGNTGKQLLESIDEVDGKHTKGLSRIQELMAYTSKT